jgi:hypothetical protein
MDNKRLLQILLRDVTELEELVTGIKKTGSWEPIEMELLSTRIAGVRHMLEMVSHAEHAAKKTADSAPVSTEVKHNPEREVAVQPAAPVKGPSHSSEEPVPSGSAGNGSQFKPADKTIPVQEDPVDILVPADHRQKETPAFLREPGKVENLVKEEKVPEDIKDVSFVGQSKDHVVKEKADPPVRKAEDLYESKGAEHVVESPTDDNMELEEEALTSPQTLGEKFVHSRSVNDLLLEHGKSDLKFSNMPVTSLHTAIGINDRFLFTRELFEGNGDAFADAIRKLDSMGSIHDAAVFLRENFKWKKNETSLKFIELVKRRFA